MNATNSPTLTQSFEVIRSKLRDPEFLACRGLGNEVPFHVFPYDAAAEPEVRSLLRDLLSEDPANRAGAHHPHRPVGTDLRSVRAGRPIRVCARRRGASP